MSSVGDCEFEGPCTREDVVEPVRNHFDCSVCAVAGASGSEFVCFFWKPISPPLQQGDPKSRTRLLSIRTFSPLANQRGALTCPDSRMAVGLAQCSMSGLAQFVSSRGLGALREWCEEGYRAVQATDRELSGELLARLGGMPSESSLVRRVLVWIQFLTGFTTSRL